jgi:5-formyltetrahydrofolate cyclo-ligase
VSIAAQKQALRERIKAEVAGIPSTERPTFGAAVAARIRTSEAWTLSSRILIFSPMSDEPAIAELLTSRPGICLPRYLADHDSYEAAIISDPEKDLRPGKFGIPEPTTNCNSLPLNQLDLVLVPGVAFAPCGARLGRGRGFYDRILKSVNGLKIGVAFDEQIVDAIPSESHDVRVDGIITPTRWIPVH